MVLIFNKAANRKPPHQNESIINVHQWRGQSGTLYKNYIKFPDRAVKLCRPYINLMFGEKTRLVRAV